MTVTCVEAVCHRSSRAPQAHAHWLRPSQNWSPAELEDEIHRFVLHLTLTPNERLHREIAVELISKTSQSKFPSCHVTPFGSFASGLSLPCSDVDIALCNIGDARDPLHVLQLELEKSDAVLSTEMIFARFPVLKVKFLSGVQADVSIPETDAAFRLVELLRQLFARVPAAREVILLTKVLLRQWGLGSVFGGGLSSTGVYLLVERFFSQSATKTDGSPAISPRSSESSWVPSEASSSDRVALAGTECPVLTAFLNFLEHCCSEPYTWHGFGLMDPFNPRNEVSRGTRRVLEIQALMKHTCGVLNAVTGGVKPHSPAPVSQLSAIVADPRGLPVPDHSAYMTIRVGNRVVCAA